MDRSKGFNHALNIANAPVASSPETISFTPSTHHPNEKERANMGQPLTSTHIQSPKKSCILYCVPKDDEDPLKLPACISIVRRPQRSLTPSFSLENTPSPPRQPPFPQTPLHSLPSPPNIPITSPGKSDPQQNISPTQQDAASPQQDVPSPLHEDVTLSPEALQPDFPSPPTDGTPSDETLAINKPLTTFVCFIAAAISDSYK